MMMQIEVDNELQEIYEERSKWPQINKDLDYVVPRREVQRRELILLLEQFLYQVEDARKEGNKNKEHFKSELCYLTKSVIE